MSLGDVVKVKSVFNGGDCKTELLLKIKNDNINDCSGYEFNLYSSDKEPSKTAVVASKDGIFYAGQTENSLCQNYIVVVNRKRKRARLLPVNMCDLSQVKSESDDRSLTDMDDFDSRNLLTNTFGSKKSKRKMELTNKMRVNADACEEQLKPIVNETILDESYLEDVCDGTESIEKLIPPCNRSASMLQNVYNIDDLITETERESFREAAQDLIENPPTEDDSTHSRFIIMHYKFIHKKITVEKATLLLYADCLIKLLKIHPKELKNRESWNKISPNSKLIASKLRHQFTESKILTVQMRQKVVCYCLVAILLACQFKIHLDQVTAFFPGIHTRKLQQLCALVGATPKARGVKDVLTLKVPLPPLPVAKSPIKKRR